MERYPIGAVSRQWADSRNRSDANRPLSKRFYAHETIPMQMHNGQPNRPRAAVAGGRQWQLVRRAGQGDSRIGAGGGVGGYSGCVKFAIKCVAIGVYFACAGGLFSR